MENFQNKLSEKGWMLPIICSSRGDVLEGHHKILAAIKLRQKTVPAYIVNWVDTKKPIQHLNCLDLRLHNQLNILIARQK